MTLLLNLSYTLTTFFYSVKNLKYFRLISLFLTLFLSLVGILSIGLNYVYLNAMYGKVYMILAFIPYLIFWVLACVFQAVKGHKDRIPLILAMVFIPSTFLTQEGVGGSLFLGMAYFVNYLERSHREEIVRMVSLFSESYSPLYKERYKNRTSYKEFQKAYRLLQFIDPKDFTLLDEKIIGHRDFKNGFRDKRIVRQFAIKGVIGKTTITDYLLTKPLHLSRLGRKVI